MGGISARRLMIGSPSSFNRVSSRLGHLPKSPSSRRRRAICTSEDLPTDGREGRGLNRGGEVQRETREKKNEELRLGKRVEGGDRSTHSLHSKLPQSVSPSVTGGGDGSGTLVRRCARISNDFLEEEGEGRKGGSQTYEFHHHHLLLQWPPRRSGFKYNLGQRLRWSATSCLQ